MSLSFEVTSPEIEKLQKYLEKMQAKILLTDPKLKEKLREELEEEMFEDLKKRFASSPSTILGGIVHGNKTWESLSDYYLAQNPNRAQGQIYMDTYALMNSLVSMTPDTISEFESGSGSTKDTTYNFGTRLLYAKKLQEMRPIVFMHEALLKELVDEYEEFLIKHKIK